MFTCVIIYNEIHCVHHVYDSCIVSYDVFTMCYGVISCVYSSIWLSGSMFLLYAVRLYNVFVMWHIYIYVYVM